MCVSLPYCIFGIYKTWNSPEQKIITPADHLARGNKAGVKTKNNDGYDMWKPYI